MQPNQANPVERTVWPWRDPVGKAGPRPAARRWRAALQAAVIAAVASLFRFVGHHSGFSLVLYVLATLVLLSGLFAPSLFDRFERFGRWLGRGVGMGVTWLLLAPFFYLCMAPGRLLLAVLGKDPMCRRREPGRASYWTERKAANPDFYTRQY